MFDQGGEGVGGNDMAAHAGAALVGRQRRGGAIEDRRHDGKGARRARNGCVERDRRLAGGGAGCQRGRQCVRNCAV
jgi:hypothetical protein